MQECQNCGAISDYLEVWFLVDETEIMVCLECFTEFDMERQAQEDGEALWDRGSEED